MEEAAIQQGKREICSEAKDGEKAKLVKPVFSILVQLDLRSLVRDEGFVRDPSYLSRLDKCKIVIL